MGKPAIFDEDSAFNRCREIWVRTYPVEPFESEFDSESQDADPIVKNGRPSIPSIEAEEPMLLKSFFLQMGVVCLVPSALTDIQLMWLRQPLVTGLGTSGFRT
ncbi:hypothetical protein Ancab_024234 [Ancistrocladus abbreviatus]